MPGWISEDIWTKLTEYWTSVEFKKKSELAKAARLSDKDGSLHTGGSISMGAHRRRLEKSLKRPATQDEVFEYTHMKKLKNGTKTTWIEPRADTTYENFMDLWIKAAGGVHKGRVYGLGSEFSSSRRSFGSGGSSSSRSSINQDEFELLNRRIAEIIELYAQERTVREEEAKRREEEDRRREEEMRQNDAAFARVTGDVESLKTQLNSLLASGAFPLPRSPSRSNKTKE
uniref:Uncharacterized protein n=1 Tax=Nicotiana tabacum TaxID=4097 RepID=A0A1S3Y4F4_TOBAC|nr:PREDICTED: uncharacterized protein LOC107772142 [Nicotiana tabacum]